MGVLIAQILNLFCFVLHLTTPLAIPTFLFFFLFIYLLIYLFIFLPEKNGRGNLYRDHFFVSRFFTICSEFAFDFSTLLGIFWTISGRFDSPLLGSV